MKVVVLCHVRLCHLGRLDRHGHRGLFYHNRDLYLHIDRDLGNGNVLEHVGCDLHLMYRFSMELQTKEINGV